MLEGVTVEDGGLRMGIDVRCQVLRAALQLKTSCLLNNFG